MHASFKHVYEQKIGSILYATLITRPDVAFTAAKLSSFMSNPSAEHMAAADRAIQFLYQTRYRAIRYAPGIGSKVFTAASDAAYADNHDRKSSEGYLFVLYGGPIDWTSKKQKTVTTSTTESELLSLSQAGKQMRWWNRFFSDIQFGNYGNSTIDCDNRQTVAAMVKDEAIQTRLRHVDVHNHWLRQEHREGHLEIRWIPTAQMSADGLTKALLREKHEHFVKLLGLVDIERLIR